MEVFNNIKKHFDVSHIIPKKNNNTEKDLEAVAQEFESLFINEMLKRAHSAKLAKTISAFELISEIKSLVFITLSSVERSILFITTKSAESNWRKIVSERYSSSFKDRSVSVSTRIIIPKTVRLGIRVTELATIEGIATPLVSISM